MVLVEHQRDKELSADLLDEAVRIDCELAFEDRRAKTKPVEAGYNDMPVMRESIYSCQPTSFDCYLASTSCLIPNKSESWLIILYG